MLPQAGFTPEIRLIGANGNGTDLILPAQLTPDRRALAAVTPLEKSPLQAGSHLIHVSLNGQQFLSNQSDSLFRADTVRACSRLSDQRLPHGDLRPVRGCVIHVSEGRTAETATAACTHWCTAMSEADSCERPWPLFQGNPLWLATDVGLLWTCSQHTAPQESPRKDRYRELVTRTCFSRKLTLGLQSIEEQRQSPFLELVRITRLL